MNTTPHQLPLSVRVQQFWSWWGEHHIEVARALATGEQIDRIAEELTARLRQIDQRLAWEVGQGDGGSAMVFVVSAEGEPALRATARRVVLAAPPADAQWSYTDLKQPKASAVLRFAGHDLDFNDARVVIDQDHTKVHLEVWHPIFAKVDEQLRLQLTFLMLDAAVGEERIELWVGGVDAAEEEPEGAVPLSQVQRAIDDLRGSFLSEDGEPCWSVMQGEGPDGLLLARVRIPLSSMVNPVWETHVGITRHYPDGGSGFPGVEDQEVNGRIEDQIMAALGADGVLQAVETGGGRVLWHCFIDPLTAVAARLQEIAHGNGAKITVEPDPEWEAVQRFG
ncbi:MAG: hypothetical protein Q4D96_05380 [Propionibacteriaceae bacterium]|nr:hypothetical protein [Propionibacteriaceae bacterium]